MKKLFLYLSILYAAIFVFFVAYIVSRQKFSESSKDIVANTVQATTEEATLDVIDYYSQVEEENLNEVSNVQHTDTFRVGIRNGYVVVFTGQSDTIYEYTDINANLLMNTDIKTYNKLLEELEFDTREEMFDFLESIAS